MARTAIPCNGGLIRMLRKRHIGSQAKLAHMAGVSERLVRYAETKRTIELGSIQLLAKALGVDASMLLFSPEAAVRSLLVTFERAQRQIVSEVGNWLSEKLVGTCWGGESLPIGGVYHGIDGMDRFFERYFSFFRRCAPLEILDIVECGNIAFATVIETLNCYRRVRTPLQIRLTLRFRFDESGKVVEFEDAFDTALLQAYLQHGCKVGWKKVPRRDRS